MNEIKTKFMQQNEELGELLNLLSNSNDENRNDIVNKISDEDLEEKYGLRKYSDDVKKYRLGVIETVVCLLVDGCFERDDLVLWSHFNAIIKRLDYLLHS